MTDKQIIGLFFDRDETALKEAENKYGKRYHDAAMRVCNNTQDAEEVCNDTLLSAWNRIPPEKPDGLGAFLSRIARNIAVDKVRRCTADKRGGGEVPLILDELAEVAEGSPGADTECLTKELSAAVNAFVKKLPRRDREMFLGRYTLSYSTSEIAAAFGCGENCVRAVLSTVRKKLKNHLQKEGLL